MFVNANKFERFLTVIDQEVPNPIFDRLGMNWLFTKSTVGTTESYAWGDSLRKMLPENQEALSNL